MIKNENVKDVKEKITFYVILKHKSNNYAIV